MSKMRYATPRNPKAAKLIGEVLIPAFCSALRTVARIAALRGLNVVAVDTCETVRFSTWMMWMHIAGRFKKRNVEDVEEVLRYLLNTSLAPGSESALSCRIGKVFLRSTALVNPQARPCAYLIQPAQLCTTGGDWWPSVVGSDQGWIVDASGKNGLLSWTPAGPKSVEALDEGLEYITLVVGHHDLGTTGGSSIWK